jgi:FkbM family methyltransferase
MSSEIVADNSMLAQALAEAGKDQKLRNAIFDALRQAEADADDPANFRDHVRWPLILSLLSEAKTHAVVLENGLIFVVSPDSRIEQALLLSTEAHPDHVWEPQTTRLLTALAAETTNVIVGGAYIGDHVLFLARSVGNGITAGVIHAFEPMQHAFDRLLHNLKVNNIRNVVANRLGLWDRGQVVLTVEGHLGLASSKPDAGDNTSGERIESISIDEYVESHQVSPVGLIMLDTEGGEEKALAGARETIARDEPNIVFEIHRHFVDWSEGLEKTSIVEFLRSQGYSVFAIRDFHNNWPMGDHPIEIIPVHRVYLEGPPHGFNALATKDSSLVERLGLRIVEDVSPKLLLHKDPALHHPIF